MAAIFLRNAKQVNVFGGNTVRFLVSKVGRAPKRLGRNLDDAPFKKYDPLKDPSSFPKKAPKSSEPQEHLMPSPSVDVPSRSTSSSSKDSMDMSINSWNWVSSRKLGDGEETVQEESIPVLPKLVCYSLYCISNDDSYFSFDSSVLLTPDEITSALEKLGGEDIRVVDISGKLDNIKFMVMVTGQTTRHLKKLSDVVVKAVGA